MILPNFSFTFPKIVHHSINIRSLPPLVGTAPLVMHLYTSWETKRCLLTLIQNTPFLNSNKIKCTKNCFHKLIFFWSPLLCNIMLFTNASATKHQSWVIIQSKVHPCPIFNVHYAPFQSPTAWPISHLLHSVHVWIEIVQMQIWRYTHAQFAVFLEKTSSIVNATVILRNTFILNFIN